MSHESPLIEPPDEPSIREQLVVVSPHFGDAALSLGVTIARGARMGIDVSIVTVLAGDVDSLEEAGSLDQACGFATVGEAASRRRGEDERACEQLGAAPVWLPYHDEQYERGGTDAAIWRALGPILDGADLVVLPGHPLANSDHAWLTRLILARGRELRVALYVEQPYAATAAVGRGRLGMPLVRASWHACTTGFGRLGAPAVPAAVRSTVGDEVIWVHVRPSRGERRLKTRAIGAYETQLDGLERRGRFRIRLCELAFGGERIGLLHRENGAERLS